MKKQIAVDSSGNPVEVFTVAQAAKYLGTTKEHVRLQMFKLHLLPHYKLLGKLGTKLIRITKADLDRLVRDQEIFNKIADRIIQARAECVVIQKGIKQNELARELRVTNTHINQVERKKVRVSIKLLDRIGKVTGKPLEWFLG